MLIEVNDCSHPPLSRQKNLMKMVLTADQQQVKALLTETITLLCKNGLRFQDKFCIEGLIGITLDEDDIFLININETVHTHVGDTGSTEQASTLSISEEPANIRRICYKRCRSSVPDPLMLVSSSALDISSAICQDTLNWQNVFDNVAVSDTEQSLLGNSKNIAASGSIQFSNIHNSQDENNKYGVSEGLNSSSLQVEDIHGSHTLWSKKKMTCVSNISDGEIQILEVEEPAEPAIADGETSDPKCEYEQNVSPDMETENLSDSDGEVSHIKEEISLDEDLVHCENSFSGYNSLYGMDVDQGCHISTFGAISLAPELSQPNCSALNRQSSMDQLTNPSLQINVSDLRLTQKTHGRRRFESNIEASDSSGDLKTAINRDFSRSKTVSSQINLAKRYECSFCGKRFSATNNLRGHLVHHTGIKEFVCSICKKEFRYKQDLKRHISKCVGESFGLTN